MTVYWQTSQKPLFIKTIWTDGHRHAVLNQNDPKEKEIARKIKRRAKTGLQKPKKKEFFEEDLTSTYTGEDLSINTVRLLLSESDKSPKPRKKLQKLVMTKSFDYHEGERGKVMLHPHPLTAVGIPTARKVAKSSKSPVPTKPIKNQHQEQSLSERVLVWLDLASQNQEFVHANFSNNTPKYPEEDDYYPAQTNILITEEREEETESELSSETQEFQVINTYQIRSRVLLEDETELHLLTGCNKGQVTKQDSKRQLHIFLPNNIKKLASDCDSELTVGSSALS